MPHLHTRPAMMLRAAHAVVLACLTIAAAPVAIAQGYQTDATAAYVIDHNTGTVLLELNADVALPPASMSKLMTLNMVFEALEDGRLSMDTLLPVSQHAMDYGGSTMFLNTADRVSVEDLIRGVIVLSGNDATAVLAEALSPDGTEDGFSQMMTERARELGMMNSIFMNSNGWPEPGHVMSMRDLGILAERLITEFPQYYPYFAETEFAFDGRAPDNRFNRNPLLGLGIGADGLKTGHTSEAGYGLVGSAVQGDRRVTFVITGLPTAAARAQESERLVNWAFRQFTEVTAVDAGEIVAEAQVFMGAEATVPLAPAEDLTILVPAGEDGEIEARMVYLGPLSAPVAEGDEVGELIVQAGDLPPHTIPLVAAATVERGGILTRITTAAGVVFNRLMAERGGAEAS